MSKGKRRLQKIENSVDDLIIENALKYNFPKIQKTVQKLLKTYHD